MKRLRKLIAELALLPRIWRALVQEAREEIAWDRDVAASTALRQAAAQQEAARLMQSGQVTKFSNHAGSQA